MAEYALSNIGEVHGIKTTTPSQRRSDTGPRRAANSLEDPPLCSRYNRLFTHGIHGLPHYVPLSHPLRIGPQALSPDRTTDRRLAAATRT